MPSQRASGKKPFIDEGVEVSSKNSKAPPAPEPAVNPTAIEINVNEGKKKKRGFSGGSRSLLSFVPKLSPIVVLIVLAYAVASTGAWGYLLSRFFNMQGLDEQVDRLEGEVDRLEVENDRLENSVQNLTTQNDRLEVQVYRLENATDALEYEVDRLSNETDELQYQVDRLENESETLSNLTVELTEQNEILNTSIFYFQAENEKLNASNQFYQDQNEKLNESLQEANDLVLELNETVEDLEDQVANLTELSNNLTASLDKALELNEELKDDIQNLTEVNDDLNASNQVLKEQVANLTKENEELKELIDELRDIMQWLNETSGDLNGTLQEIADALAAQVQENREIILRQTHQNYQMFRDPTTFECEYSKRFGNEQWGINWTLPIQSSGGNYTEVIYFADEKVLSELCANLTDFELFLSTDNKVNYQPSGQMPPEDITSNQLLGGQDWYTLALLDYYFPGPGEDGLTTDDWVAANYTCDNFSPEQRFIYGVSKNVEVM